MRIQEEYKKSGYFWLPEQEDKKIPGIITISDGGKIELEIIGHFDEEKAFFYDNKHIERIIGHIEKDSLVTLDRCLYSKKNFAFGGISKSTILVQRLLSGAAWEKNEAITFNTFSFAVDCLDEWVGLSGIAVEHDWENHIAQISYKRPEDISITLDNGMTLEICFTYTTPGYPITKNAEITQQAYFNLVSEKLRDLNEFTSIAYKITNLMCFAIDDIVTMKNVSATSSEIERDVADDKYPTTIKIYYQSIPHVEKEPNKHWREMLFRYATIKDNTQQVFNNWINAYEYLSPPFSLYFSTKAGAQKYLDSKFLALAQGLETYHRRTSDEKLMENDAFESLVSTILKSCPAEHADWLQGRLMHGNEINLGKRLKRIIEPFKEHLGSSKERSKLLRQIVNTRNYLTHYNEDLEHEMAKGRDLWLLCLKMEVIFNLHFLNIIGFTADEIEQVIKNSESLKKKLQPLILK
ncbi:TPA: hypothetical protein U2J54_000722 [Providencia rettgeri]|nr:hypothetical protein [Providencia rettgeri]HEM8267420.1 hypothetical protein [Providencia rettgeri]